MTNFFKILFVLMAINIQLVNVQGAVAGEAQAVCETCNSGTQNSATDQLKKIEQFGAIINSQINCADKSSNDCLLIRWLKLKYSKYAGCKDFFLSPDGGLGTFSKKIATLIANDINTEKENSIFLKTNPDTEQYCPGFKDMTPIQKIAYHSWIFELTAFPESSCKISLKPNAATDVPNGPAVCMYQLELAPSLRSWRSAKFKTKNCAVSADAILTLDGCTGCAFDEYKRHTVANGRPFGTVDANGLQIGKAYWASHNPLTPKKKLMWDSYQACREKNKTAKIKTKCDGSNEWEAPIKFFGRLPRFPLCKTKEAQEQIDQLPPVN